MAQATPFPCRLFLGRPGGTRSLLLMARRVFLADVSDHSQVLIDLCLSKAQPAFTSVSFFRVSASFLQKRIGRREFAFYGRDAKFSSDLLLPVGKSSISLCVSP